PVHFFYRARLLRPPPSTLFPYTTLFRSAEPYSRGRSSHAQPIFSTYRMPFNVRRSSLRVSSTLRLFFGMSGSSTTHCSSVSSCLDRKSTRLNSSHVKISYAVFCLKKKKE